MGPSKFDALARRQAGYEPGFIGSDETHEEFEARTAAEERATRVADPADAAPYWPTV